MSAAVRAPAKRITGALRNALLVLTATAIAIPLIWVAIGSLKTEDELFFSPLSLPRAPSLAGYRLLFTQFQFGIASWNSILISLGVVAISVVLGGMAAYGFSRYPFTGSRLLLSGLLVTRMVTPAALVVPLYLVMNALSLLNNVVSIIIGVAVLNLPLVVWILRPFFDALPREVEEAGLLDGLSPLGVFFRIALPLVGPGLLTVGLLSFIAGWTDLLFPISFSTTPNATPLTSGLLQMQTGYKVYWTALMAGSVYITLPTVILCFALQKYLVRGIRLGY